MPRAKQEGIPQNSLVTKMEGKSRAESERLLNYEPTSREEKKLYERTMRNYDRVMNEVSSSPGVTEEVQASRWQKVGKVLGGGAKAILEAPGKTLEHLATPVAHALRMTVGEVSLMGKETLQTLFRQLAEEGSNAVGKTLSRGGRGLAEGTGELFERAISGAGKGTGVVLEHGLRGAGKGAGVVIEEAASGTGRGIGRGTMGIIKGAMEVFGL